MYYNNNSSAEVNLVHYYFVNISSENITKSELFRSARPAKTANP